MLPIPKRRVVNSRGAWIVAALSVIAWAVIALISVGCWTDCGDLLHYVNKVSSDNITAWHWLDRLNWATWLRVFHLIGVPNPWLGPLASWSVSAAIIAIWTFAASRRFGVPGGVLVATMLLGNPFLLGFMTMGYPSLLEALMCSIIAVVAGANPPGCRRDRRIAFLAGVGLLSKATAVILPIATLLALCGRRPKRSGYQFIPRLHELMSWAGRSALGLATSVTLFALVFGPPALFGVIRGAMMTSNGGQLSATNPGLPDLIGIFSDPVRGTNLAMCIGLLVGIGGRTCRWAGGLGILSVSLLILISSSTSSHLVEVANYYTTFGVMAQAGTGWAVAMRMNKPRMGAVAITVGSVILLIKLLWCHAIALSGAEPTQWNFVKSPAQVLTAAVLVSLVSLTISRKWPPNTLCEARLTDRLSFLRGRAPKGVLLVLLMSLSLVGWTAGLNHAWWYRLENAVMHDRACQIAAMAPSGECGVSVDSWQWIDHSEQSPIRVAQREASLVAKLAHFYATERPISERPHIRWADWYPGLWTGDVRCAIVEAVDGADFVGTSSDRVVHYRTTTDIGVTNRGDIELLFEPLAPIPTEWVECTLRLRSFGLGPGNTVLSILEAQSGKPLLSRSITQSTQERCVQGDIIVPWRASQAGPILIRIQNGARASLEKLSIGGVQLERGSTHLAIAAAPAALESPSERPSGDETRSLDRR